MVHEVVQVIQHELKRFARRILKPGATRPVLGNHPYGGPKDSPLTFVVVVREGFNINVPNANSAIRLGFCHGFAQIGVRYRLVDVAHIGRVLPQLQRTFVFLSVYDYLDVNKAARRLLRDHPHFVWAHPDREVLERAYAPYGIDYVSTLPEVYGRVLDSEPTFVWAPTPPSGLEFYSEWQKLGLRLESVPLACDTTRYYREPENRRYSDVKMAFVGGYWAKKAIQFDKYLKPYEDILSVYGYSRWPYSGYGGLLPEGDERVLYQNARVCPAISEPHAEVMGDIVERPFKVMGSGGLAVTDVTPFFRELFTSDELLAPQNRDEYREMVRRALEDDDFNQRYRERGYKAILERHTYVHRARQILDYLGIDLPSA